MSETRAAIFHCPFCAEEDLFPVELEPAAHETKPYGQVGWECRSCLRVFSVKLLGLSRRRSTS